jgi:hypothetical protein
MPRVWTSEQTAKANATRAATRLKMGAHASRREQETVLPPSCLDDYATPLFGGRKSPRLSDEWICE